MGGGEGVLEGRRFVVNLRGFGLYQLGGAGFRLDRFRYEL